VGLLFEFEEGKGFRRGWEEEEEEEEEKMEERRTKKTSL
jgi:hypothetical protein